MTMHTNTLFRLAALSFLLTAEVALPAVSAAPSVALSVAPSPRASAAAAQRTEIEVSLQSGLVKVGERTSILIRVKATNKDPQPVEKVALPEVAGLAFGEVGFQGREVQMGPDARGRMTQISTLTYSVPVTASGAATYEIPPITVTVDGKETTAPLEALRLKVVEDIVGSKVLLLELEPLPERIYEGEPYTVDLTLGWLNSINREDQILQVPWFGRQDGVIQMEQSNSGNMVDFPIGPGRRRTAAMERLGAITRAGDRYVAFALKRRFVATRPGKLDFARTVLEVAERRGRGRFGRSAVENYYQVIPEFSINVVPVPDVGRPVEWTGALGQIAVDREALRRDIDAGDSIEFELRYSGEGNIEFFDAPDLDRLPAFESFRVLGVDDEKQPYLRIITYDLVPMSADVKEIPPVPLSVFDTSTETFVTLTSEPMEIRVRATEPGTEDPFAGLEEEGEEPVLAMRDIAVRPDREPADSLWARGPGAGAAALSLLAAVVGWVSLRRFTKRRGNPAGIVARRRRAALGRLERDLGSRAAKSDPRLRSVALETFLSARTNTAVGHWIGRSQFEAEDLPSGNFEPSDDLQRSFDALRSALDRPVFGGEASDGVSGANLQVAGGDKNAIVAFAKKTIEEGL